MSFISELGSTSVPYNLKEVLYSAGQCTQLSGIEKNKKQTNNFQKNPCANIYV
jgi:hypothetical protein